MLSVHDAPVARRIRHVTFNSQLFFDVVRQQFATRLNSPVPNETALAVDLIRRPI